MLEWLAAVWLALEDAPLDEADDGDDVEVEFEVGADVEVEFEVGADAAELPDVVFVGEVVDDPVLLFVPDDVLLEGAEADEEDELVLLFACAYELPIVPTNTERTDANAIIASACLLKVIEIYYCKVIFKIYIWNSYIVLNFSYRLYKKYIKKIKRLL